MDAIDLKLLTLLQENAKMSVKELAKAVFLSAPATAERIKKLEEQEIIEGYVTRLNLKKLVAIFKQLYFLKRLIAKH